MWGAERTNFREVVYPPCVLRELLQDERRQLYQPRQEAYDVHSADLSQALLEQLALRARNPTNLALRASPRLRVVYAGHAGGCRRALVAD